MRYTGQLCGLFSIAVVIGCHEGPTTPVKPRGVITTVAGDGPSFSGDGGSALAAKLSGPSAIAIDPAGNVYIADQLNLRIRRVTPSGTISTVAGNGVAGSSGDGGQGVAATLTAPSGVAVDADANIYVSDQEEHRIRVIDVIGIIRTIVGDGTPGFSGDGGAGNVAKVNSPGGLSVDGSGNLYIADAGNNRIRKLSEGMITTVAGTGTAGSAGDGGPALQAQLNSPRDVAVDAAGNLYVADEMNNRIRKISPAGIISTYAGTGVAGASGDGGQATQATLTRPLGIAVDKAGNVYIADTRNIRVRRVNTSGVITAFAGSGRRGYSGDGGSAVDAQMTGPHGLAVSAAGNLLIADYGNNQVRRVDAGVITRFAGNGRGSDGDGGQAIVAQLAHPRSVALDIAGNIFISDWNNNRIRKVNSSGVITTVAGTGATTSSGDGGPATQAGINVPHGIAVDGAGNIYITDSFGNRVRRVGTDGVISTIAGNGQPGAAGDGGPATAAAIGNPSAVALDAAGNLYISQQASNVIRRVSLNGTITTIAGTGAAGFSGDGGPATQAQMRTPIGIASDAAGDVYVAEQGNNRIRRIGNDGIISTVAGNGTAGFSGDGGPAVQAMINSPFGVGLDTDGNVFVVDSRNERIRRVGRDGIITTVAGSGVSGYSGDGGPATQAQLRGPHGVALDAAGNIYIADSANDRIRRVSAGY